MSALREYLLLKRDAVAEVLKRVLLPGYAPRPLKAIVTVEGRSGIRRIRLRDHQLIVDSPPDLLGYDLGPTSPELALGALGGCLAHSWLIQAARLGVPLDSVTVEVTGHIDARAGEPGHEATLREPQGISYAVTVESAATTAELEVVQAAVDRLCPILNLLRNAQEIRGSLFRPGAEPYAA